MRSATDVIGSARASTLVVLLVSVLTAAVAARALAGPRDDPALASIEPRITEARFEALVEGLAFDDDQRLVAELLFSDYAAALESLAVRLDAEAVTAGRERVERALAGTVFVEPQELRRLRAAVLEVQRQAWPEADQLLEELLGDVRGLTMDAAGPAYEQALRAVRRAIYLQPRRGEETDEAYAGEGVDVVELVDEARAEGGELAPVGREALAAVLEAYERDLDRWLLDTAAADRAGRMSRALARIERDREALRGEDRAAVVRWQRLYALNETTVARIETVAGPTIGADGRRRRRDRFDAACFPRLFRDSRPQRQHAWIASRVSDSEVLAAADPIAREHRLRHAELGREAAALIVTGRREHGLMLHASMDPTSLESAGERALYQDLLRNSGRRAKLNGDASDALKALLTEGQRRQMRADLAAAAYGRRR